MKFLRAALSIAVVAGLAYAQAAPTRATKLPKKKAAAKVVVKKETALPEKKVTSKKTVAPPGRITQLPAFTAKRRTYSPPVSGVVIRSMTADEYKTYAAQADAEAKATALVQQKLVAKPLPIETMQIDDLESQVIDEISDAPHPVVAEAAVPSTTVTTLPPLAPSVVAIPDSDESLRKEVAVLETTEVKPTPEPAATPVATPVAVAAPAPTPEPVATPEPTPAPTPTPLPAEEKPEFIGPPKPPEPTPVHEEDRAKTETLANDLELRPARIQHLRLHVAYLDARYGNIQSDLENGSTTVGFAYGRDFDFIEGRVGLDLIHGLDQKVELGDSRTVLLRVDAAHYFAKRKFVSPYVSSGLGYAISNVRSYRSLSDGSTVVRDHLESKSLAFIPGAGARINLASQVDLDLGLEYLGLFGGANASSLGGLSAGGSIGFTF